MRNSMKQTRIRGTMHSDPIIEWMNPPFPYKKQAPPTRIKPYAVRDAVYHSSHGRILCGRFRREKPSLNFLTPFSLSNRKSLRLYVKHGSENRRDPLCLQAKPVRFVRQSIFSTISPHIQIEDNITLGKPTDVRHLGYTPPTVPRNDGVVPHPIRGVQSCKRLRPFCNAQPCPYQNRGPLFVG